jgi:hypothetical protein
VATIWNRNAALITDCPDFDIRALVQENHKGVPGPPSEIRQHEPAVYPWPVSPFTAGVFFPLRQDLIILESCIYFPVSGCFFEYLPEEKIPISFPGHAAELVLTWSRSVDGSHNKPRGTGHSFVLDIPTLTR